MRPDERTAATDERTAERRAVVGRRRRVAVLLALLVIAAGVGAGIAVAGKSGSPPPRPSGPNAAQRMLAAETRTVVSAESRVALGFPVGTSSAAPVWSPGAFDAPLPRHVVFGFAPYYSLGELTPADYADVTTIAYDGVQLLPSGALDERPSDLGWAAMQTPSFDSLVATAHRQHDQVLLTVFSQTPSVITAITRNSASAGRRLAEQLQPLVADHRLDGVDVDVEGSGKADRAGFVRFMRAFTSELRLIEPAASIVLDTYPGSAGDPRSFFDVAKLAKLVDTMFVMAYDMYSPGRASPNAPLASPVLGLSDVQSMLQYVKVVPPRQLLLGIPFYGYDFPTRSGSPHAATSAALPTAVTWHSIVVAGHPALWDGSSETPWYRFKRGRRWHETYFDDPASVALKTSLAAELHLQGVGVWSLGMEGGDGAMLAALLGGRPPKKLPLSSSTVLSAGGSAAGARLTAATGAGVAQS